ncbi:MAG TPA: tetratricopeptide repeat protein [Chthonomonas sp.]|uniref:tetratricopeptide repeat protein n=1 Tax=Chthonomonas sp. TaxID=2282153 RepID=UPI002B4B81B7|nr:tetratricopeptide repeat protein [Chthonomonas sp.]HLI48955.1 tetratricopeptide repeat protein [Chthonomonas sp.]
MVAAILIGAAVWLRMRLTEPASLMHRYMEAVHLAEAGDYGHAVAIWQQLLVEYPSFPYTYFQLGRFYTQTGHAAQAVPLLQRLVSKNPKFPEAQQVLAEACLAINDAPCALQAAKQAVAQSPHSGVAHDLLSAAYGKSGDLGDCIQEVLLAERYAPSNATIWLHGANIFQQAQNVRLTEQQARRCVLLNPNDGRAWYLLGWALNNEPGASNELKALQALQRAVALQPQDALALTELGAVYLRLQRNREAVETLLKARHVTALPDADGGYSQKHLLARARVARLLAIAFLRTHKQADAQRMFMECQVLSHEADKAPMKD